MEEKEILQEILSKIEALSKEVSEIKQIQIRMEHNISGKVDALFDAREVQFDWNHDIASKLNDISAKVNKIEWKILKNDLYKDVK